MKKLAIILASSALVLGSGVVLATTYSNIFTGNDICSQTIPAPIAPPAPVSPELQKAYNHALEIYDAYLVKCHK